ncbi:MAG: hypothetical protein IT337_10790 [Thermomicrobiales bacterium]|nr:hypothetical protein [Thermomicrobiales bacterium]
MSALDDRIAMLLAKREADHAAAAEQRSAVIREYNAKAAQLLRESFGDLASDARFELYTHGDYDPNRRFRVHLGDLPVFDVSVAPGRDLVVFDHGTLRTVRLGEMLLHLVDLPRQDAPSSGTASLARQVAR